MEFVILFKSFHLSGYMGSLQGPFIFPAVHAKQTAIYTSPINKPFTKAKILKSRFWELKGIRKCRINMDQLPFQKGMMIRCSFSSSSNSNGSMAESFNENDADYINSSIVEADEVKSGPDGFLVRMRDGRCLHCVHNNPQDGHLPDYAPHPAIVLKMEDGTGLLLPIIVLEMSSMMLMDAVRNDPIARPTMYRWVKEMIDKMGYTVKLVRITKRVHEAYFAELYLQKSGDETEGMCFDLRPSDAINIAVRCKVPIQVNKYVAYSDGMRVVESAKLPVQGSSDSLPSTELDQLSDQLCVETKEFYFLSEMMNAADEERYGDAADWRDKLIQFRSEGTWT